MRKRNYIILAILAFTALLAIAVFVIRDGLMSMGNPNGSRAPYYPYFITKETVTVKNIELPKGTKLTYEEQFFREGQQDRIMTEKKLTDIEFPKEKPVDWGGVPVYIIRKFFNSEMGGYSVYADFGQLSADKTTKFSEMWQSCGGKMGILVKNTDDWSFDKKNIVDISSCSVTYQRFFREDTEQQRFLDKLLGEIKKNDQKQAK